MIQHSCGRFRDCAMKWITIVLKVWKLEESLQNLCKDALDHKVTHSSHGACDYPSSPQPKTGFFSQEKLTQSYGLKETGHNRGKGRDYMMKSFNVEHEDKNKQRGKIRSKETENAGSRRNFHEARMG